MRHSEMINSIVETEKRAHAITQAAKNAQLDLDTRIAARTKELREKYMQVANAKIYETRLSETEILQKELLAIDNRILEAASQIDKKDSQNHDLWVKSLVDRITAM